MLTLVAPHWLLGLLLLPVIRWLHRGGQHRRTAAVSHLGLWRGAAVSAPAAGKRRPPDPAWRRRALLTALLLLALAGPGLPVRNPPVTVWVDDSLSMLTREAQATRLVEGLAQVRSLLSEFGVTEAEVRTLADPWTRLGAPTEATAATISAAAGRQAPAAPPLALLRPERLHWLVTDGAHEALVDWPEGRRPDRIVQVASVTRNVGLERLSARRSANDADKVDLLLRVTNGGSAAETRVVSFVTDGGESTRSSHRLEPGASVDLRASIPAAASIRAALQPGDALVEDDQIMLDLSPLRRRRVSAGANCPRPLVAAVGAHPALALAPEGAPDAEAVLDCGARPAATGAAAVHVLVDRMPTLLRGQVQWSSGMAGSRHIRLQTQDLQASAQLQVRPADTVLLAVGGKPVMLSRPGPPTTIETSLDFDAPALTRSPDLPLLVNLMFVRLFGSPLLDAVATIDRGKASSRVAPQARIDPAVVARVADRPRALVDWSGPIVLAALLALLWEMVATGRQWLRLSHRAEAGTG